MATETGDQVQGHQILISLERRSLDRLTGSIEPHTEEPFNGDICFVPLGQHPASRLRSHLVELLKARLLRLCLDLSAVCLPAQSVAAHPPADPAALLRVERNTAGPIWGLLPRRSAPCRGLRCDCHARPSSA